MFEQIKLEYGFDALEPHIDTATMETHYSKHHATYTKNLNDLTAKAGIADKTVEQILGSWKKELEGKADAMGIRNNGGGYYNHNLYFGQLSPQGGGAPEGELAAKIDAAFGGFASFKDLITKLAIGQFGSGWAWLATDADGNLSVSSTANQDNPILVSEGKVYPILGIDVWEHAYYLKYRNLRASYVDAFFEVLDWTKVEAFYNDALKKLNNK